MGQDKVNDNIKSNWLNLECRYATGKQYGFLQQIAAVTVFKPSQKL